MIAMKHEIAAIYRLLRSLYSSITVLDSIRTPGVPGFQSYQHAWFLLLLCDDEACGAIVWLLLDGTYQVAWCDAQRLVQNQEVA
jgi:hypothetical protein